MGNWRTVDLRGHMDAAEACDMIAELTYSVFRDHYSKWDTDVACLLMGNSLCGLNQWAGRDGDIDAVGNLAERDFDNDDIEKALVYLAKKYPSLDLTLHSGSDWESLECSATFVVTNGEVKRLAPQVGTIREISADYMQGNLMRMLYGR